MASAKIRGKVIEGIRANLRGGLVQDFNSVLLVSGQSVGLDPDVYESRIHTPPNAGLVTCLLPIASATKPLRLGQRHLVTYEQEDVGGDGIRINAATSGTIVTEAFSITATGYARAATTNVDLLSGNDQALFEYAGLSGAVAMWNLVYSTGGGVALS